MGHTAIWQHGAKERKYNKFEIFQIVVNIKASVIQIKPKILNVG